MRMERSSIIRGSSCITSPAAQENVVLLVYGGEDHGLRKKADQVDYQRRIFAWFGYYLKGDPAAKWITEGDSYLDHQRELKATKPQ